MQKEDFTRMDMFCFYTFSIPGVLDVSRKCTLYCPKPFFSCTTPFCYTSREGNTFTEFFFGFCSIFQIFNTEVIKMAARMRTFRDALKTIKELDPGSAVTYNFIKQLCETDKITNVRLNKKYLLNLDELLKFLNMED